MSCFPGHTGPVSPECGVGLSAEDGLQPQVFHRQLLLGLLGAGQHSPEMGELGHIRMALLHVGLPGPRWGCDLGEAVPMGAGEVLSDLCGASWPTWPLPGASLLLLRWGCPPMGHC